VLAFGDREKWLAAELAEALAQVGPHHVMGAGVIIRVMGVGDMVHQVIQAGLALGVYALP